MSEENKVYKITRLRNGNYLVEGVDTIAKAYSILREVLRIEPERVLKGQKINDGYTNEITVEQDGYIIK